MKTMDRNWIIRCCLLLGASVSTAATAQELSSEGMLEENLMRRRTIREELVPEPVNGRFRLPELNAPTTTVEVVENRERPQDFRDEQQVPEMSLPESGTDRVVPWNWTLVNWEAANTFSNPRYFEDRMLERHGHVRWGCFQPVASGARFFATIPMLPYLMTINEPCDCEYTLGYYRPGSCAPALVQRPPYDRRALVMEGLVVAGVVVGIP
jgi:hypothetical protein